MFQYVFTGFNLIGESYLYNIKIKIIRSSGILCCQVIFLEYTACPSSRDHYSNDTHDLVINQLIIHEIFNHNQIASNPGLFLQTSYTNYNINIVLKNSCFYNMGRTALQIKSMCSPLNSVKRFLLANCTFKLLNAYYFTTFIKVHLSPVNNDITFLNCTLHNNTVILGHIITISIEHTSELKLYHDFGCFVVNNQMLSSTNSNISFIKCQFENNSGEILMIENKHQLSDKINVFIKSSNFSRNEVTESYGGILNTVMISFTKVNVYIKGPVIF